MFTINKTDTFNSWLASLRDLKARTRIAARIKNAEIGNFGDYKPVGEGVYEMRVDVGAGYWRKGRKIYEKENNLQ